ncbi:MAG: YhcH/YjgK/YiaL family protein [Clostridia bacterium]
MLKSHAHLAEQQSLPPIVVEVLHYLRTLQKDHLPAQSQTLGAQGVYVNFANTVTMPEDERSFEAHEAYADLHFIVSGTERIDLGWTMEMLQTKPYDAQEDFALYEGKAHTSTVMSEDEFLLCLPGEAHRVLVAPEKPAPIQKAIAKIPVSLLR